MAKTKESAYPEIDLRMVFSSVLALVTKTVRTIKVVETGTFILVRISRMIGAAVYR